MFGSFAIDRPYGSITIIILTCVINSHLNTDNVLIMMSGTYAPDNIRLYFVYGCRHLIVHVFPVYDIYLDMYICSKQFMAHVKRQKRRSNPYIAFTKIYILS